MSKYEIEIEGLPDGWEPVAFRPCGDDEWFIGPTGRPEQLNGGPRVSRMVIRRKTRKYDWSKTLKDVFVRMSKDSGMRLMGESLVTWGAHIPEVWQPNIHGVCPVDPEASIVKAKFADGTEHEYRAVDIDWSLRIVHNDVIAYQFIRLADGVEW